MLDGLLIGFVTALVFVLVVSIAAHFQDWLDDLGGDDDLFI